MNIEVLIKENKEFENIMKGISDDIKKKFIIRKIKKDTIIVSKDDYVSSVNLVYSGNLRIINEFDSGYMYSYADIAFMDIVGDIEVLSGRLKFAATVKSTTDCVLINISTGDFMYMFENSHNFSKEIAKMLARKMYPSSYERGNYIYYSVEYSLTKLIVELVKEDVLSKGIGRVTLKRVQISERLATSVRSVNRIIKKLRESGYINIVRGKVSVNLEMYKLLLNSLKELN